LYRAVAPNVHQAGPQARPSKAASTAPSFQLARPARQGLASDDTGSCPACRPIAASLAQRPYSAPVQRRRIADTSPTHRLPAAGQQRGSVLTQPGFLNTSHAWQAPLNRPAAHPKCAAERPACGRRIADDTAGHTIREPVSSQQVF